MKCKNCSQKMFHPGGDAIEWACSWCGHIEWFAEWREKHPRQPTPRAADGNKILLNGTFRCPECNFSEKHLASCSRR